MKVLAKEEEGRATEYWLDKDCCLKMVNSQLVENDIEGSYKECYDKLINLGYKEIENTVISKEQL